MQEWLPYLELLLGADKQAVTQAVDLLTFRNGLDNPPRSAAARLNLAEWVAGLDSTRKVFLAPSLVALFQDDSASVRLRALGVLEELASPAAAPVFAGFRPLLQARGERRPNAAGARQVLDALDALEVFLASQSDVDGAAGFAALLGVRDTVVGLSLLRGLGQRTRLSGLEQERHALDAWLRDDDQTALRSRLHEWLLNGPLFVRYLLVQWLGESGVVLTSTGVTELLFDRYANDPDPLVAAAAAEAFARSLDDAAGDDDVDAAARRLWEELSWLAHRSVPPRSEALDVQASLRTLTEGLVRALGQLAVQHPGARVPLTRFDELLQIRPDYRLDLFDRDVPEARKRRVLSAAQAMHGDQVLIRARINPGQSTGFIGIRGQVNLAGPHGTPLPGSLPPFVWVKVVERPSADPVTWRYEVIRAHIPMPRGQLPVELLRFVTPWLESRPAGVSHQAMDPALRPSERQVIERGGWALAAFEALAAITMRALRDGAPGEQARARVTWLTRFALSATAAGYDPQHVPERRRVRTRLRDAVTRLFLKNFAREEVFDALFPPDEPLDALAAELLTGSLGRAALRSLRGEPERRWIEHETPLTRLREAALEETLSTKVRASAALILKLALHERPDAAGFLDAPSFDYAELVQENAPTVCFAPADALAAGWAGLLESEQGSGPTAQSLAVAAETLARALEAGEPGGDPAEAAAAACLRSFLAEPRAGAKQPASLVPYSRRRLLQAYAAAPARPAANGSRVRDWILRTATAAELEYFLERRGAPDPSDVRLVQRLSRIAAGQGDEPGLHRKPLDTKAMEDRLARPRVALAELVRMARAGRHAFHEMYRRAHHPRDVSAPEHAIAGEARLLSPPLELLPEPPDEVLANAWPTGSTRASRDDLGARGMGLEPAFGFLLPRSTDARMLLRMQPAPSEAIDFHAVAHAPDRQRLLDEVLSKHGKALAAGRVAEARADGSCVVDLGVSLPGRLRARVELVPPAPARVDDPILVQIHPRMRRHLRRCSFDLWRGPDTGYRTLDLRGRTDGIHRLHDSWTSPQADRTLVAATVEAHEDDGEARVRCRLRTGFTLGGRDGLPVIVVPAAEAPPVGAEVLLLPTKVVFDEAAGAADGQLAVSAMARTPLVEHQVVFGTLCSTRPNGARRRWTASVGEDGREFPVPRAALTADLLTLYALDELPDDAPALRRLAEEPRPLRVSADGREVGLLAAPAVWRSHDLMVAAAAGDVADATFVGEEPEGGWRFELLRAGSGPGSLLGAQGCALLERGELFDDHGVALTRADLESNTRVELGILWGTPDTSGAYTDVSDSPEDGEPFLALLETDTRAQHFVRALTGNAVRMRVDRTATIPRLAVHPQELQEGFPIPKVMSTAPTSSYADDSEVPVTARLDPYAEELAIRVTPSTVRRLSLQDAAADVFALLRRQTGLWTRNPRIFGTASEEPICFVGSLPVDIDPALLYLLPDGLPSAPGDARALPPVRLLRVEEELPGFPLLLVDDRLPPLPQDLPTDGGIGLVVTTPLRPTDRQMVGVLWALTDPDDPSAVPQVSSEWTFELRDRPSRTPKIGHRVVLQHRDDGLWLVLVPRHFKGTLAHPEVRLRDVSRRWNPVEATLLARPRSETDAWHFMLPDARVLKLPAEQLADTEKLSDEAVWSLDHVTLVHTDAAGPQRNQPGLRVDAVSSCVLHRAVGTRFELEPRRAPRWERDTAFKVRGPARVLPGLPPLPVTLSREEVRAMGRPPGANTATPCTVTSYDCTVAPADEPGLGLDVALTVTVARPGGAAQRHAQRESLDARLGDRPGNRLEASGRVVSLGGREMGVVLDAYLHAQPIPLPVLEQSWLPYTGEEVTEGWAGTFAIVRTSDGPLASLRRRSPRTLDAWLAEHPDPGTRLLYVGPLRGEQLRECDAPVDAETPEGADRLVLFEINPGKAVLADVSRLTFRGAPFLPDALQPGDAVRRFNVYARQRGGPLYLNVQQVDLDLIHEITELTASEGVVYGIVNRHADGKLRVERLRGAGYRTSGAAEKSSPRWTLVVEEPAPGQAAWVEEVLGQSDVYLTFVRADRETGTLVFRLLADEDVFQAHRLVWVEADSFDHHRRRLNVRPLGQAPQRTGYHIPETRFSERLGRLREPGVVTKGDIILARVVKTLADDPDHNRVLSLTEVPDRSYSHLLRMRQGQVIVKPERRHGELSLEAGVGVNVRLPVEAVEGWRQMEAPLPGDILTFRTRGDFRVELEPLVRSHRHYVHEHEHPTFLIWLWAGVSERKKKLAANQGLNCGIVGLSQLRGITRGITAAQAEATGYLAGEAEKLPRDEPWVYLRNPVSQTRAVGRLVTGPAGPALVEADDTRHPLDWDDVTFFEGTRAARAGHVARLRWRNRVPEGDEPLESIAQSDVIGVLRPGGRVSLTAQAEWCFPVDHLREQFAGKSAGAAPRAQWFVVAAAKPDGLVLEVAPGRYAELPASLVAPGVLDARLAVPRIDLAALAPGDQVTLAPVRPDRMRQVVLPPFRITGIRAARARETRASFFSVLRPRGESDGEGEASAVLGPDGAGAFPADRYAGLADRRDHVADLSAIEGMGERYVAALRLFDRVGPRLVLRGRVHGSTPSGRGTRYFLEIGIPIPVPGRDRPGRPSLMLPSSAEPLADGAEKHVRVLDIKREGGRLAELRYRVEDPGEWGDARPVRGAAGRAELHFDGPAEGDAVMVRRFGSGTDLRCEVVGAASFSVRWVSGGGVPDAFAPHRDPSVLEWLLPDEGSVLWATVEHVSVDEGSIFLSRRGQLARVLPRPDTYALGQVQGLAGNRMLVVDLLGVLCALPLRRWCHGAPGGDDLAELFEGSTAPARTTVEVCNGPQGELDCLAVYALPDSDELDARVQYVTSSGVVALAGGVRIYVPARELAMCPLTPEALRVLFPPGTPLVLRRLEKGGFSHVFSANLRADARLLERAPELPVFIRLTAVHDVEGHRVVRGRSGLLMALRTDGGKEPRDQDPAYVQTVHLRQRRVVLSPDEAPARLWSLPPVGPHPVDAASPDPLRSALGRLASALDDRGVDNLADWAGRQSALEASPRNLRRTLEEILQRGGGSLEWTGAVGEPKPNAEFHGALRDAALVLSGQLPTGEAGPAASFAAGYWLVRTGRPAEALPLLQQITRASELRWHVDVPLTLAYARYHAGDPAQATLGLRALLRRLWTNAVRTLPLPYPHLGLPGADDPDVQAWEQALTRGEGAAMRRILQRHRFSRPDELESAFPDLWLRLATGSGDDTLSRRADGFLELLDEEITSGRPVSARYTALAALLCFARGDLGRGVASLRACGEAHDPDPAVPAARFWSGWLAGREPDPDADPLLCALLPLLRQCAWREACEASVLNHAWNAFVQSWHRWVLDLPGCRVVPAPPTRTTAAGLRKWMAQHDAHSVEEFLADEIAVEPT
jgi:hypothetical protein